MAPPHVPVRFTTLRLRALSRADATRLRRMPLHPVHTAAMRWMDLSDGDWMRLDCANRVRLMLAREVTTDAVRGYLAYHLLDPVTVMLDYLYSPHGGGTGTKLMDKFEAGQAGKTVLLMATAGALAFYTKRGYDADGVYMLSKRLGTDRGTDTRDPLTWDI